MSERDKGLSNENIWAPWRTEYITSITDRQEGACFVCTARDSDDDLGNLVLWRGPNAIAMLNRFPYTGGHTLICPNAHVADMCEVDDATMDEISRMSRDMVETLKLAVQAHGYNIGCNLGAAAGAGLPGHLHWHVVPRWQGDTNYLEALAQVRMVPVSLEQLQIVITDAARELKLPWSITENAE
jgi:ATP adenylyltransferase